MKKLDFNANWSCNGKAVTLPHDAQITEIRSKDASNGGHGYFPGGVYTYEKTFSVPADWQDKDIVLEFEGVYKNATVKLNGSELCFHPYGYTNFFVELKDLKPENTLTVIADNSKLPNSRWYSGSGIYRPVWLYVCEKGGIRPESVKIDTLSLDPAIVRITSPVDGTVTVFDGEKPVASGKGKAVELTVKNAKLWSDTDPNLYRAVVTCGADTWEERFGIRRIEWSPKGFFINGRETLLRGGCVHHDSGILGAATFDRSEYRRVRILKENGFNAIRASHNPASRALLEACDELGMYVMDETFDM
jgi:beta-galactosidase/beta-glucuronidase